MKPLHVISAIILIAFSTTALAEIKPLRDYEVLKQRPDIVAVVSFAACELAQLQLRARQVKGKECEE